MSFPLTIRDQADTYHAAWKKKGYGSKATLPGFVRRPDLLSKVEILIALTFSSSLSSVIHASLKSNTPLILVLLHVFFWNDIHDVLSICKSYGHFTISPISPCTRCMRLASFTTSPAVWISVLALLAEVIGCFRVTQSPNVL